MERNNLYPVFLKTSNLRILIVGGGFVAEEKLHFLTKSSPDSNVTILAPFIREKTLELAQAFKVDIIEDTYRASFLKGFNIVIATTDDPKVNQQIYRDCRKLDKLVNVADNPPL